MNPISIKGFLIITGIAIVGILITKALVNRAKFIPDGIKKTVNAV